MHIYKGTESKEKCNHKKEASLAVRKTQHAILIVGEGGNLWQEGDIQQDELSIRDLVLGLHQTVTV